MGNKNSFFQLESALTKCFYFFMEKAMAPHSSTLVWKIPWTEEPGRQTTVHGVAKSRYEGQINCSQEMHSNKIKWNCTLLLPCLICTLYLNIQYDGMSLNCATGINEVMHWRRKWQPTPVFLPGESQGPGSLVGCLL